MVTDLLMNKPKEVIPYMIDWLRKKGNVKDSSLSEKEREE